jgi:hypothetical protein
MTNTIEPDELRRLLADAVGEIRPDPEAYQRIRDGVRRRRRLRVPALAAGGVALAGVAALTYVLVKPGDPAGEPGAIIRPPITATAGGPSGGGVSGQPGGPSGGTTSNHGGPRPSTGTGGGGPGSSGSAGPGTAGPSGGSSGPHGTAPGGSTPGGRNEPGGPSGSTGTSGTGASPNPGAPGQARPNAIPAAAGDLDGDGRTDRVTVADGRVTVAGTRFGTTYAAVSGDPSGAAAIVDVNRDGFGEVIVDTGAAAGGGRTYAVYTLTVDGLRLTTGLLGTLETGIFGGRGYGLRCDSAGGRLITVAGTASGGQDYSVTSTSWRLDGTTFTSTGTTAASTVAVPSGVGPFTVTDCGSLS